MTHPQIILSGSISQDRIMVFDGLFEDLIQPDKLQVLSVGVLVDDFKETRGGIAANIAYNLALLGEKPILLGSVGESGREYMTALAELGVDVESVHYSDKPTGSFSVLTDKNDCQVGGFYPGAMSDASSLSFKPWEGKDALAVISAHDPDQMLVQIQECKTNGMRLFFDPGQQALNLPDETLRQGIEAAELLMLNDYELGLLEKKLGWGVAELTKKVDTLVVTLGEKGCQIYDNGEEESVGALKLKKVIDPTGAGDAFRAGFLYGYVRNWELKQAAQLGAVVASFAIQAHGTQEHHFTREEVVKSVEKTYGQKIQL